MRADEYAACDATALAKLVRDGDVTADEVYATALEAIRAVDRQLNAVANGPWERPLAYTPDGPFGGVPFALKDLGAHPAGVPVKSGTRLSGDGVVFDVESYLVGRFREAGLATAAMTTAPEFGFNPNTEALAYGGSTRNPWNLDHSAGGSSGGSAALVAAGGVPAAHAGDGGGSIRIPAAWTGLVGLKPSRGRTSDGPEAQDRLLGLGCEFAVTRTMRDTAALLDAVAGSMPGDPFILREPARPYVQELGADPGKLRIGITTDSWCSGPVDPETAAAVEAVGQELERLGHHVERATPRFDWDEFAVGMTTLVCGFLTDSIAAIAAQSGLRPGPETLERTTIALYEHGLALTAAELAQAMQSLNTVTRTVGGFFTEWDLLLTPTTNVPAVPLGGTLDSNDPAFDAEGWVRHIFTACGFTAWFNWSGTPAISLPLGTTAGGLPIGVQLAAPMCGEATLIRVGSQLEQALPWADRRPAVYAGASLPA